MNVKGKNSAVKMAIIFMPEVSLVVALIDSVMSKLVFVNSITLLVDIMLHRWISCGGSC